jgi:hypothetical protein
MTARGLINSMETYQKTIFAIVRGGFVVIPILAIAIIVANAFDHPLQGNEIGATAFIILIGFIGFFATRLIQRVVFPDRS